VPALSDHVHGWAVVSRGHYAHKVDGNQPDIMKALNALRGVVATSTARVGDGFPDIAVGYRGRTYLFELKDPSRPRSARALTAREQEWHLDWTGHAAIAETVERIKAEIGYEVADAASR
jgi:hypothetical protein